LDTCDERGIGGVITDAAEEFGGRPFLVDPRTSSIAVTYAELRSLCGRVAASLEHEGVEQDDAVILLFHNCPLLSVLLLGVMASGRVAVPMNPLGGDREVAHALDVVRPSLVVGDPDVIARHRGSLHGARTVAMSSIADIGTSGQPLALETSPDQVAEIVFTSGSTGRPKGAQLTHGNIIANSSALARRFGVTVDDRFLAVSPLFHNSGQIFTTFSPLFAGAQSLPARTDIGMARFGALIDRHEISWTLVVNAFLALANRRKTGPTGHSLRGVLAGGSVLPASTIEAFEGAHGTRVYQVYGLTESTSITTCERPGDEAARSVGSAGTAIEHATVRVDSPAPSTGHGEIMIEGPHVFAGYANDPEATAQRLPRPGVLKTGDLGWIDDDGNLHIVDRLDNMLICGGENIYPAEIEQAAEALGDAGETVATAIDDEVLGVRVALVYEGPEALKARLRKHLATQLSPQKSPAVLVSASELGLAELPRAANGKVLRDEVGALVRGWVS